MFPSCIHVFLIQLLTDWRNHLLHCHHPSCLPTHVHLHLHLNQSNLKTEKESKYCMLHCFGTMSYWPISSATEKSRIPANLTEKSGSHSSAYETERSKTHLTISVITTKIKLGGKKKIIIHTSWLAGLNIPKRYFAYLWINCSVILPDLYLNTLFRLKK